MNYSFRVNLRRISPFVLPPALALFVYAFSLGNGFAMIDDGLLIFENNLIREISPSTLWTAFTSYDPELYIPLTFLSYQIDYLIGGLHPFIYHLTNLLLHAGSSLLVAVCGFFLFADRRLAIIAGMLFAVHPLHSEAVAWASARKDLLSGFFFLLSVVMYLARVRKRRADSVSLTVPWYYLSIGAFLLALLSKVSAAPLPLILLLMDFFQQRKIDRHIILEKIPFFLLALLFGFVALGGKSTLIMERSFFEMMLLACKTTVFALFKILFPLHLSVFYPELSPVTLINPLFLLSVLLMITGAFSLWFFRKQRVILFSFLFFGITLAPAFLTVVKGGNTFFFSDRYAYLPSMGIIFLVCVCLREFTRKHSSLFTVVSSLLILLFIPFTALQARFWGNSVDLFSRVTEHYPEFYLGHINLGAGLREAGKKEEAITEFRKAIELHPLANTYGLVAQVEAERRNYREAVRAFGEGIAMQETDAELHYGLGQVYALMGERENAVASYERALELSPMEESRYKHFARRISSRRDKILLRMGLLYGETGDHAKAMEFYEKALLDNPLNADAEFNLAVSLGNLDRTDEAMSHYERARDMDPSHSRARVNLAILYVRSGRKSEAIKELRIVLKIDPFNIMAKNMLPSLGVTP